MRIGSRAFDVPDGILFSFKAHARSGSDNCEKTFIHIRTIDSTTNENVRRASSRNLRGPASNLSYVVRCKFLDRGPLWIPGVK